MQEAWQHLQLGTEGRACLGSVFEKLTPFTDPHFPFYKILESKLHRASCPRLLFFLVQVLLRAGSLLFCWKESL